ncbi:MAG TPA: hypothetical protein ENL06_02495 [Candidatus Portnoybacteria bacterium]|nr:hypothetical protein [Candidatus Portnoybacteria bacterium]
MNELNPQQLNNPIVREKVNQMLEQIFEYDDKEKAFNLLQTTEKEIEQYSNQLLPQAKIFYQSVVRRLKFLFWPVSPIEKQMDFLKNNLAEIIINSEWYLNHHLPWENQILAGMFMYPLIPRNNFRKTIKQVFDQNQGKIGHLMIKEWLNDYNNFQDFIQRTAISHLEYLAQSSKVVQLSEKAKESLRQMLGFYDSYLLMTPTSIVPLSTIPTINSQQNKKMRPLFKKQSDDNIKDNQIKNSQNGLSNFRNKLPNNNNRGNNRIVNLRK